MVDEKLSSFYSSIKSRMMVGEVISNIENNANFTFDFLMLLTLAAILAFIGLVESSSVVLVASMLISPLMGPILAGVFGTVIKDNKLRNVGILHELISLCLCIIVGFILGLLISPCVDLLGLTEWPTTEMKDRGTIRSLVLGILVAIPSGAGVALSVLGGNAGSLVGVAISASLLPPAVNAGVLWAVSLMLCFGVGELKSQQQQQQSSTTTFYRYETNNSTLSNSSIQQQYSSVNSYTALYSERPEAETALLGLVSLCLTGVNILCIILTGIAILRLKEVTPEKIPQSFQEFWKKDVRARRGKYSRLQNKSDMVEEGKMVGLDGTVLQDLFDEVAKEDDLAIRQWVPRPLHYTVIKDAEGDPSAGPGYRINKTTLLRLRAMQINKYQNSQLS